MFRRGFSLVAAAVGEPSHPDANAPGNVFVLVLTIVGAATLFVWLI
jgi:hypothetical protein